MSETPTSKTIDPRTHRGPYIRLGEGTAQLRIIWMDGSDELIETGQRASAWATELQTAWGQMREAKADAERCYTVLARAEIDLHQARVVEQGAERAFYSVLGQARGDGA